LIGLGFNEIISPIFVGKKLLEKCLINEEWTKLKNPVSEEYSFLRKILFPSIMNFFKNNIEKEYPQKIFEIGYVVENLKGKRNIAFAIADSETNLSELISYINAFFKELNLKIKFEKKEFPFLIKGRSGIIVFENEEIGFFGEVHPQVLENFGIFIPICYCEIKDKIYSKI
jgi:phenylalanyl-tRNA synthetase beta chain